MESQAEVISAVQAGDGEKLQRLLEKDRSLAGARDKNGVSAIMQALYTRHPELLKSLLAAKADPDIFEATAVGQKARVLELLRSQPELVHSWSADGFTALHFACFFGQEGTGMMLLEHGADPAAVARNPMKVMPLHSAASARNTSLARALVERGAPVNARQAMGWAPLHAAAQNGDQAMTELLLAHGADARAKNDEGVDALELAKKGGHAEVVKLLEK
ncbi:MAG TPA: ankyrin repeat domain-containing protein [Terriglobales bacterium]|nr:ankyrin repeat domain-containing protein [Terriglobales bacterium]